MIMMIGTKAPHRATDDCCVVVAQEGVAVHMKPGVTRGTAVCAIILDAHVHVKNGEADVGVERHGDARKANRRCVVLTE